jgi:hypothetical protein
MEIHMWEASNPGMPMRMNVDGWKSVLLYADIPMVRYFSFLFMDISFKANQKQFVNFEFSNELIKKSNSRN